MGLQYLHLRRDDYPPRSISGPFQAIIISEMEVAQDWRNRMAEWLLESGCLCVVAWGVECEIWHDTVDRANGAAFDFGDVPEDKFVMTWWFTGEPLSKALWFAGQCAFHPAIELDQTTIIHISEEAREVETLKTYLESQMIDEDD